MYGQTVRGKTSLLVRVWAIREAVRGDWEIRTQHTPVRVHIRFQLRVVYDLRKQRPCRFHAAARVQRRGARGLAVAPRGSDKSVVRHKRNLDPRRSHGVESVERKPWKARPGGGVDEQRERPRVRRDPPLLGHAVENLKRCEWERKGSVFP